MTFILVHCTENKILKIIGKWKKGLTRENLQDYFMEKLDPRTFLMEANGELLALLWSLKERYDNKLDLFIAEPIYKRDLPIKLKEVIKCLKEQPKMKKELVKVKNLKIECLVNLKME